MNQVQLFSFSSHLIWVDDQDRFAVDLLDLLRSDQVSHPHRLPAGLSLPQHSMHGGQEGSDVTLLPLNPVKNLGHKQGVMTRTRTTIRGNELFFVTCFTGIIGGAKDWSSETNSDRLINPGMKRQPRFFSPLSYFWEQWTGSVVLHWTNRKTPRILPSNRNSTEVQWSRNNGTESK